MGADSTTGLRDFAIDLVAMGLLVAVGIEPLVDVASTLVVQWRMGDEPEEALSVKRWAERTSYPNTQRLRGAGLRAGGHRIEHGTVCHKKTFGVLDEDRIVTSGGPSRRALLLEAVSGLATR